MPLSQAVISYDISDYAGTDFDARRTKVYATNNVIGGAVIDTDGNKIYLGSGNATIAADGTGSISVPIPGAGSNPASWQTTIHVDYPDRNNPRGRTTRSFGPFTITASANLADLVPQQEVPAEFVTQVTAQLDAKVTEAEAAATAAGAHRAAVENVVITDLGTTDGQTKTLIETDGTLTKAALSATFAAVVTPQAFGAACDGTADDTAAVQAAINNAATTGRPVEISGRVKITAPLVLPTNKHITIRAAVTDANPFGSLTENRAAIESSGSAVFTPASASAVKITLTGINFRNLNGGISTALFDNVKLNDSLIEKNTIGNYNYAFKGAEVAGVTRVTGNRFLTIKTAFCSGLLVDSMVSENYINGSVNTNSTVFTGGIATSFIGGNYIDFFKRVFDCPAGQMAAIQVVGNIFDYCWNTVGASADVFLTAFVLVGNRWIHCKASVALPYFTAPDTAMTTIPWSAIDTNGASGINRTSLIGNGFSEVDTAIRLTAGIGSFRESGNSFGDVTTKLILTNPWFTSQDVSLELIDRGSSVTTYAAGTTIDFGKGASTKVTLTGNITALTLINALPDQIYEVTFVQDGTGSRTLSGVTAKVKWAGGVTPTLSTEPNKRDIFRFKYNATDDAFYEISRTMNVG